MHITRIKAGNPTPSLIMWININNGLIFEIMILMRGMFLQEIYAVSDWKDVIELCCKMSHLHDFLVVF